MLHPLPPHLVLPAARRSLRAQADRLKGWATKSNEKDAAKIAARARELGDIAAMVDLVEHLQEVIEQVGTHAYQQGFDTARMAYDQSETVKALSRALFGREY